MPHPLWYYGQSKTLPPVQSAGCSVGVATVRHHDHCAFVPAWLFMPLPRTRGQSTGESMGSSYVMIVRQSCEIAALATHLHPLSLWYP